MITAMSPQYLISESLQRFCRPSPCFRRDRAFFLCRTRLQKDPPPSTYTTKLQRKVQRNSLRSAQRRRATGLCPHRSRGAKDLNIADHTIRAQSHGTDYVALRRRRSRPGAATCQVVFKHLFSVCFSTCGVRHLDASLLCRSCAQKLWWKCEPGLEIAMKQTWERMWST